MTLRGLRDENNKFLPLRSCEECAADKALNRARQAISMLAVLGRDDHLAEVEKAVREARERRT